MKEATDNKQKIFRILTVACVLIAMVSLFLTSSSWAKYTSQETNPFSVSASAFYFRSNELTEAGAHGTFNSDFSFYLYNFDGANKSEYDITYSISVTNIVTSGSTTVTVSDNNNGTLTRDPITGESISTISVAPHPNIQSFKITVSTTNGYAKTLSKNYTEEGLFAGGSGTSGDPYQISTWQQLYNVRDDLSAYYILNNDLDSSSTGYSTLASSTANSGLGWDPIGGTTRFIGHFDGNEYTISDLYIDRPTQDDVGLFGHIGVSTDNAPTTIQKVCLADVDVTGARGTGALVGRVTGNQATLIQYACVVGGSVTGTGATGGLVGSNNSYRLNQSTADNNPQILYSYSNVAVYGVKDNGDLREFEKIGGLVGCSQKGTVINCYSHSSVTVNNISTDSVANVGGLVGSNLYRGILRTSYSTGAVSVNYGTNIGGVIGRIETPGSHIPVSDCYWDTTTSGMAVGDGIGSQTDSGVTGLLTAQMQDTAASTNMSALDFVNIWQTVTSDYPVLQSP